MYRRTKKINLRNNKNNNKKLGGKEVMEKINGYDSAIALTGEYERLKPGGYICKIIAAKEEKSKSGNRMLTLALDIAEGERKGFFMKRFEELKKEKADPNQEVKYPNAAVYRQMLEGNDSSLGFLKGLMTSLEASNSNFKWNWDEKKLVGLTCGAIFAEEEYEKLDGSVGTTCKIKFIRTTKCIEEGNFKVPELKKLPEKGDSFEFSGAASADNLPF